AEAARSPVPFASGLVVWVVMAGPPSGLANVRTERRPLAIGRSRPYAAARPSGACLAPAAGCRRITAQQGVARPRTGPGRLQCAVITRRCRVATGRNVGTPRFEEADRRAGPSAGGTTHDVRGC